MKGLETQHRPRDTLDEAVVLIENIVEVYQLDNLDDFACIRKLEGTICALTTSKIGPAFVDGNSARYAICTNGVLEGSACPKLCHASWTA